MIYSPTAHISEILPWGIINSNIPLAFETVAN